MKGKVVVVTGASKGIGAELARQLAAKGAKLVLAARDLDELEKVAVQCREAGGHAITVRADVTAERDCAAIMSGASLAYGRIDILVNNAGATMWGRFEEIEDVSVLEGIMKVNYMGAVYCTKHALPYLRQSGGLLVGIASLTALTGVPTRTGYAASKHAMRGFFDSLRIELDGSGVGVTMIYPGFVATGIRENAIGPGAKPQAIDPVDPRKAMSVEECARQSIAAIQGRRRELVMTAKGKLGVLLRPLLPGLIDRVARRTIAKVK